MVITADGERLKGSAAKKYKDQLAKANGLEPRRKNAQDAESKSKIGCRIRMLRSAKEWSPGDLYEVRGASSGCWKVVGKNGTHHIALNKADIGKVWAWSEFQSHLTDVGDAVGDRVRDASSVDRCHTAQLDPCVASSSSSSDSACQPIVSIALSGFWRSEFNQSFHFSQLLVLSKPIYVTVDNKLFLYIGIDNLWRICPMEGLAQAQSSGDCGHASAVLQDCLSGAWNELVDLIAQRWETAHCIQFEIRQQQLLRPLVDSSSAASQGSIRTDVAEEPLAKRSRVVPLSDPELDLKYYDPLNVANKERIIALQSSIISRLPKAAIGRQVLSKLTKASPRHQDEILSFAFQGRLLDGNGRLVSKLTQQDAHLVWSRFEEAMTSVDGRS